MSLSELILLVLFLLFNKANIIAENIFCRLMFIEFNDVFSGLLSSLSMLNNKFRIFVK